MNDLPHAGVESARLFSIFTTAWAVYAQWITDNGAVVLTTLGIAYAVFQFWARQREHKAIMEKNQED